MKPDPVYSIIKKLSNLASPSQSYHKASSFEKLNHKTTPITEWKESWKRVYYKEYPRFEKLKLLTNHSLVKGSLKNVLLQRTSQREYSTETISFEELSTLLHYAAGINPCSSTDTEKKRFYPSAGARYPTEIYIIINSTKCQDLKSRSYHYNVKRDCLEQMFNIGNYPDFIGSLVAQEWIKESDLLICMSNVFDRTQVKYGERGYRFLPIRHCSYFPEHSSNLGVYGLEVLCDRWFQ